MYDMTMYLFTNPDGSMNSVTVNKSHRIICDCIEYARFGSCDHTVAVEEEYKPIIYLRHLP